MPKYSPKITHQIGGNTAGATANIISGTYLLAGGNNITLSQDANSITISGGAAGGGSLNISAGTTSNNLTNVTFADSNGLSFGLNASTITASHNGLTSQSNQNVTAGNGGFAFQTLSFSNVNGFSFGTSAGSAITGSYTVPSTAGLLSAINVSGGTTSNNLSAIVFSNSNAFSFGLNGSTMTGSYTVPTVTAGSDTFGMSNLGNTSGTTGVVSGDSVRFLFAGGNNITLSQSLNGVSGTLTISAANQTNQTLGIYAVSNTTQSTSGTMNATNMSFQGAGVVSVGVSNGSVVISAPSAAASPVNFSAGTTSNNLGTVVFSNSNGVSFGLNGSTITASVAGGGGAAISAGTQSVSTGTVAFSNSNGVSFGMSGSNTVTASVSGIVTFSSYNAYPGMPLVAGQQGQATLHIQPYIMPSHQYDRVIIPTLISNASNSSGSLTLSVWVGIYTKTGSTLSLASSTSMSTNFSGSGTAGSYSLYGGPRNLTIGSTNTINAGMYWMGVVYRSTTGGANLTVSQLLQSQINSNWSGDVGVASNATKQVTLGLGVYTVSTAGMPNSIGFTQINGSASLALRPPAIYFLSQTA